MAYMSGASGAPGWLDLLDNGPALGSGPATVVLGNLQKKSFKVGEYNAQTIRGVKKHGEKSRLILYGTNDTVRRWWAMRVGGPATLIRQEV
jgi:hypothetical protein